MLTDRDNISRQDQDGICLLTLSHGDENRFSEPFVQQLRDALSSIANDDSIRAVVVTGGHVKYFSNGLDLDWMSGQTPQVLHAFLNNVDRLLRETVVFPKPMVGAINGHAFALGCIWPSVFDLRIMRQDRGWACLPEMDINVPIHHGMLAAVQHCLGVRTLREMLYTARRYGGPEAVAVGWASEAVPQERVVPRSIEMARFMAEKTQPAFAITKKEWAKGVVAAIDESIGERGKQ